MIICQVTGAAITVAQNELLTTGMVQAVPVRFRFSPQWAALDRTAVFTAGTVSVSCLLGEDNQCFIPWECLTRAGEYLRVGVYGTRGEKMVLPTVSCLLGPICTGTQPEENTPTEATPTLVQSLLTKAEAAVSVADALRTDADAGLFNGRDGKDGTNGKDGKDGQNGDPGEAAITLGSITLTAAGWSTEEPYSQAAALAGLTAGSLVALHPTAAQLMALQEAGVTALTAANANGRLCSGGRPRRRSDPADYHHCHGAVKFSLSGSSPVGRQNSTQPAAAHFGGGFPQNTGALPLSPKKSPQRSTPLGGL